jgi:MFS family permease
MIIPKLPSYLTNLGGAEYKGLIISLFTITALVSRPFSGKIADKVGRIPVMIIGTSFCFFVSLMYPLISSVAGFLLLRLVHGFSTGFTPTGLTAYLSDIIPAHKRGEAMGLLGTAGTIGMSGGLAFGPLVANNFGLNAMFYTSSAFAVLSIGVLFGIKETLSHQHREGFSHRVFKIHKRDLLEPKVWVTCVVMLLTTYSYGAVFTVMPDFCAHVGIRNEGLPFTFLTVASLSVRLIAGRASDYYGRRNVLFFSTVLTAGAMLFLGLGSTRADLMIAMTLYGLAHGITSPTLFAWATDLSDENHKGRGISSLYIFMELGIGVGAFASGLVFHNDPANFFLTFAICSLLSAVALIYLISFRKTPSKITHTPPVAIDDDEKVTSELDQM